MMIKFSVVIPLYNKAYSIIRCLDSILIQSEYLLEIIIVNDGSTDNSLEIVSKNYVNYIDQNLIRVIDQKNQGASTTRNKGVKEAVGKFVCFLDADDEWLPGYLEKMSDLILDFPEADLYSQAFLRSNNGKNPKKGVQGLPEGFRGYVKDFFKSSSKGNVVLTSTACVRKEAFVNVGGFPLDAPCSQDLHLWIMLAVNGKVATDVSFLTIQYLEKDNSRHQRKNSVPYPLVFFSKNASVKITSSLHKYLFTIFYKHFIVSLLNLKIKEALLRLHYYIKVFLIYLTTNFKLS